jgi:hypothetical protein
MVLVKDEFPPAEMRSANVAIRVNDFGGTPAIPALAVRMVKLDEALVRALDRRPIGVRFEPENGISRRVGRHFRRV